MSSRSAVVLFTCFCVSPALEILAGTPNGLFLAISWGLQQHTQTFFFFGGTLRHMGSWFPNQESNRHALPWKCGVLNTGKSQIFLKREKDKHWKNKIKERGGERWTQVRPMVWAQLGLYFLSLGGRDVGLALHHGHPVLEADICLADSVPVRSSACSSQEAMTLHGTTGAWLAPGPFWGSQQSQIQSLLLVI